MWFNVEKTYGVTGTDWRILHVGPKASVALKLETVSEADCREAKASWTD